LLQDKNESVMEIKYNIEEIQLVEDLKKKVIQLLEVFNRPTDISHYSMILYLLALQKEGILQKCNFTIPDLNIDISLTLDELESDKYQVYKKINDDYYYVALGSLNDIEILEIGKVISTLNQSILEQYYSLIFEDLIYSFSKIHGKISGESLMPMELCRFMCELSDVPKNGTVYNPFAGLASFGVFLDKGQNYFGQEQAKSTWALGGLRLAANDRNGITTFSNDDSILYWPSNDDKYDLIISNPPFGFKLNHTYKNLYPSITTIEQFVIEKSISSLKHSGKLITIVPHGFLFRGGSEKKTREFLVKSDLIESIISIPGGLYSNTSIPVVVLVINKSKNKKGIVNFIDANNCVENSNKREKKLNDYRLNSIIKSSKETDSFKFVSNETIVANDYNLNVARYFINDYQGVRLGDLVSEVRGQRINEFNNEKGKLVRNRDLKSNPIDFSLDINDIQDVELKNKMPVVESCLLLATRDKHIKPTFFVFSNTPIYLYKGIYAFKVDNSKIDLEYLVSELNADYVSEQINAWYNRSVLPIIDMEDLLNIKIHVPSLKEQKAKVEGVKQAFIDNKKKELAYQEELLGLKDETFREFASIKHTLRQYLNALTSNVSGTRTFILNNQTNGVTLDTIYSKNLNKTLGEHLIGLEGTIASMRRLLISNESSNQLIKELDLFKLVGNAQIRFQNAEIFQFEEVYFDKDSFAFGDEDDNIRAPIVSIDEDDFYRIFSNIVSNAIDHGFKDNSKKYSIRTSITFDEQERMCILEVSNNGRPMPQKFTLKDLTTSGEKTTDSKGTGMGGADIKNILKKYGGTVDLNNLETDEFPVTYIIKLPLFTINL
jgi:type I restriction enzyme M protein